MLLCVFIVPHGGQDLIGSHEHIERLPRDPVRMSSLKSGLS